MKNPDCNIIIQEALNVSVNEISDLTILKKGMTNHSYRFACNGEQYILRIPGEGTEKLINRAQEAAVYRAISGKGLCDDPIYINPDNGVKISRYLSNTRVCNPNKVEDVNACINKMKQLHRLRIEVDHSFELLDQIEYYENLRSKKPSIFEDYQEVKNRIFSLRDYISGQHINKCLTHIDAVPDNFLFNISDGSVQLTDWEYSGMQDPHLDIAMFCVYSNFDKKHIDGFIDLYFDGQCDDETRIKIYCYIASSGLLWSNWCEYKECHGITFGTYAMNQYNYASEYSLIALEGINA